LAREEYSLSVLLTSTVSISIWRDGLVVRGLSIVLQQAMDPFEASKSYQEVYHKILPNRLVLALSSRSLSSQTNTFYCPPLDHPQAPEATLALTSSQLSCY
jgi:hypothetical protein